MFNREQSSGRTLVEVEPSAMAACCLAICGDVVDDPRGDGEHPRTEALSGGTGSAQPDACGNEFIVQSSDEYDDLPLRCAAPYAEMDKAENINTSDGRPLVGSLRK